MSGLASGLASGVAQDFRAGLRTLTKRPGHALAVILTLAIGIGANTAIFSVLNSLLLQPLPWPNGEQLVVVNNSYPKMGLPRASVSIPDYIDRREQADAFEDAALYHWTTAAVSAGGQPEQLFGIRTTESLFTTLGTQPFLGRNFMPDELVPGQDRVVILSHDMWQSMFGGDKSVIGKILRVDGESYEVVGVLPEGFVFPNRQADYFVPFAFTAEQKSDQGRGNEYSNMIARLRPGASVELAEQQMQQIVQRNLQRLTEYAGFAERSGFTGVAQSFREEKVGDVRAPLMLLQITVGLVLLIACANVANLMMARVTARRKELSVRTAMGAGRLRIARQLLIESLMLSLLGGFAGVLLAHWGLAAMQSSEILPSDTLFNLAIDRSVLLFALLVAIGTGLLFGLFPVLSIWRSHTASVLKDGTRSSTGSRGAKISRSALVVVQVTMAVTLLVAAGLLMRSFIKLQSVDPGFTEEGVLTASVSLPEIRYPEASDQHQFYDRVESRLAAIPGVTAVGIISALPFSKHSSSGSYGIAGYEIPEGAAAPHAHQRISNGEYFEAMQISLQQGRLFDERDTENSARVAIIDSVLAEKYFPDKNPIGHQLHMYKSASEYDAVTIIGVVDSVQHSSLKGSLEKETIYHPFSQQPRGSMMLALRVAGNPDAIVRDVRNAVLELDSELPLYQVETMSAMVDESLAPQRAPMVLLGIFSFVAVLLAFIGLYGVLAYSVVQRTSEFGIRMALGASGMEVLRLVLAQGGRLVGAGLLIGLLGAVGLAQFMSSQLFGVNATDPLVFSLVLVFIACTGLIACLLPARRATRVHPMEALRYE